MALSIRLEIANALDNFQINEAQLRELLTGRNGPVMRDLAKRAIRVQNRAKSNATGRPGPNVITGRLKGSITWRLGRDSKSPYADVGTAVHYAPFVELGHKNTKHVYPVLSAGGTLHGFAVASDRPTRPYPFLRPALEAARSVD